MIGKYLISLQNELNSDFLKGINKINNFPKFKKLLFIFWILGPFIYLIERDPADVWLTSISLIFIIRCIIRNDWNWINQWWFKLSIFLWALGLFSSVLGPYKYFSFMQGLVWIRFPLYVAAAQVWLGKDKDIRGLMFLSICLGMIFMCLILTAELLVDPKERLIWPYGDLVPGNYLSKVSLPVYCTLIILLIRKYQPVFIINGLMALVSLVIILLTGERTNFLIRFFSSILACFSWKLSKSFVFKTVIYLFFIISCISIYLYNYNNYHFQRITNKLISSIPILNMTEHNSYWGAWRGGIQQGIESPIIGLGPSSSRKHCTKLGLDDPSITNTFEKWYYNQDKFKEKIKVYSGMELFYEKSELKNNFNSFVKSYPRWLPGINYCGNHPHNFYIQLFAETGIIGLVIGSMMFFSLVYLFYVKKKKNPDCPVIAISYIIPLAFFFPLQQMGSFYGQWGNLFIWFPIGFCMSYIQDYNSK